MSDLDVFLNNSEAEPANDFGRKLSRCLSMIIHFPEVKEIAEVVLRVKANRSVSPDDLGKDRSHE